MLLNDNKVMYPVSKAVLLDGIEQRLLFPASPSSLCLWTPQWEQPAVDLLVAVPSAMVADFGARREALRAQLDIWAVGAAEPQVGNVCEAVNAVLLSQVRHLAWLLLLVVGGSTRRMRATSLTARSHSHTPLVNIHGKAPERLRLATGLSFQDDAN